MSRMTAASRGPIVIAAALIIPLALGAVRRAPEQALGAPFFAGTWFGTLDAEPFGLPPGVSLAALLTINADGTLIVYDAGDFGAPPISQVQSPQFGSWVRTGGQSMQGTTLFFAGDPATLDTTLIKRVRFRLRFDGGGVDRLVGEAEIVEQIACPAGPLPGFLSCPNPITAPPSAWVPEPGGAPNVAFEAWRLQVQ